VPLQTSAETLRGVGITQADLNAHPNLKSGKGCDKCQNTGFKGRQGLYELLMVDEPIRRMTVERSSSNDMRAHAIEHQGMRTLIGDGKLAVLAGRTTPEEVLRVCQRELV
jgi:general secretion pathway protein E